MAHRVAEEAALRPTARAVPVERDRMLVKLSLPRDALIEFEVRCRLGNRDETRATLAQIAPAEGARLHYEYDFGDSWEHEITVVKIRLFRRICGLLQSDVEPNALILSGFRDQ